MTRPSGGKPIFYSLGDFLFQNETPRFQPWDNYVGQDLGHEALPSDFYDARIERSSSGSWPGAHPDRDRLRPRGFRWRTVTAGLPAARSGLRRGAGRGVGSALLCPLAPPTARR